MRADLRIQHVAWTIENQAPETHFRLGRHIAAVSDGGVAVVELRRQCSDGHIFEWCQNVDAHIRIYRLDGIAGPFESGAIEGTFEERWQWDGRSVRTADLLTVGGPESGRLWLADHRVTIASQIPPASLDLNVDPWIWIRGPFIPGVGDVDDDGHADYVDTWPPRDRRWTDWDYETFPSGDGHHFGRIHMGPLQGGDLLPEDGIAIIANRRGPRRPWGDRPHGCRLADGNEGVVFRTQPGDVDGLDHEDTLMVAVTDLDTHLDTYETVTDGTWREIRLDQLPDLGHGRIDRGDRVIIDEFQGCGDFDGDGVDELLFGGQSAEGGEGPQRLSGSFTLAKQTPGGDLFAGDTHTWRGNTLLSRRAAFVPDLNDDGREEIVAFEHSVPRPAELGGGSVSVVRIFLGDEEMELEPDVSLWAEETDGRLFTSIRHGDIDEDGLPDLIIGAPSYMDPEYDGERRHPANPGVGRVYVVFGKDLRASP